MITKTHSEQFSVGTIHESRNCGKYKVTEYVKSEVIHIEFIDTGTTVVTQGATLRNGCVKDKMFPIVYGKGFIGIGKEKARIGKKHNPLYSVWFNMMVVSYHVENERYKEDVTVCDRWLNFQTFASDIRKIEDHLGQKLKYLRLKKGTKQYSPNNATVKFRGAPIKETGNKKAITKALTGKDIRWDECFNFAIVNSTTHAVIKMEEKTPKQKTVARHTENGVSYRSYFESKDGALYKKSKCYLVKKAEAK